MLLELELEPLAEQLAGAISSPQSNGLLGGGAGMYGAITLNIFARPPVGVQLASAIRPPGAVTRASSRAAAL